jgi:hypothetical protein
MHAQWLSDQRDLCRPIGLASLSLDIRIFDFEGNDTHARRRACDIRIHSAAVILETYLTTRLSPSSDG